MKNKAKKSELLKINIKNIKKTINLMKKSDFFL